jgi:hypothetical protein
MEWLIMVLIWVGFGIAGLFINKAKNRSPFGGFCWGFFLGIIGLLIAALIKPKALVSPTDPTSPSS